MDSFIQKQLNNTYFNCYKKHIYQTNSSTHDWGFKGKKKNPM